MVIAFGLCCCSAALTVLSPAAATARAIAVIVSFTHFMVFLRDYRLAASQVHKLRADSGQVEARRPHFPVMAGLVPAISVTCALCPPNRDRRDEPGDDKATALILRLLVMLH